ncbi:MAG: hypothetical protein U0L45_09100 [Alistipes sp.]|nr:hypothetical protein [Alistipes sp.]
MAITLSGYTRQCGRQSGGVSRIGIAQVSDIKDITAAEGVITGITFNTGASFKDYQSELDQAEFTYNNGETSLLLRLNRVGKAASVAVKELEETAPCGLVALAQLNNGETVVIGYTEEFGLTRPILNVESNFNSGKALTDDNFVDVTLKTSQVLPPLFLSETVDINSLFAAGK